MNESAARSALGNVQQPIDLEEFERRLRGPAPHVEPNQPQITDPLAELAKIVDSVDDPLRDIFGQQHPQANPAGTSAYVPDSDHHAGQYHSPQPPSVHEFSPEDAPAILRNVAGQMREPDPRPVDGPVANLPVLPELPAPAAPQSAENYKGWDPAAWQPVEPPPFTANDQQYQAASPQPDPEPVQPVFSEDAGSYYQPQEPERPADIAVDHGDTASYGLHQGHEPSAFPNDGGGRSAAVHHLPVITNAVAPQLPDAHHQLHAQQVDPVDEFEQSVAQLVAARAAANSNVQESSELMAPVPVPVPANVFQPQASEPETHEPEAYDPNAREPVEFQAQPALEPPQVPDIQSQIALPKSAIHQPRAAIAEDYLSETPSTEGVDPANINPQGAIPEYGQTPGDGSDTAPWEAEHAVPPAGQIEKRSRKPLYITAAAIGAMVIGIGATLGMRSSGTGDVPTIAAIKSPLKIPGKQVASNDGPAAANILGGKNAGTKASNVVARNDEPIDLSQVPAGPKKVRRIREEELSRKLNLADRNVAKPIAKVRSALQRKASGYFPEPRRVRTVMVRPDGTLIDPTATSRTTAVKPRRIVRSAPARSARNALPIMAAREAQPALRSAVRTSRTVSRKSVNRAGAIKNRSRPSRTAALNLTPDRSARRARAATAARPASGSGRYAVQLAAPGNENAAKSTARRLKQRYGSVLNGRTPTVHRAVVRKRTVWRVRVTGMNRKAAVSMCSRLQGRGGKCFVARN